MNRSIKKATKPTPKEMLKKRKANHPIIKIPLHERNVCVNKENVPPEIILKNKPFRIKDRETENFFPRNPFDVQQRLRLFTKCSKPMKPKPEPFIMSDVHTICDYYDPFYKVIEGRPLRRADDVKVYVSNIRDIFLFKADTAYLNDKIIQIDNSYAYEMEEYNKIDKLLAEFRNSFVQFAKINYNKSLKIQKAAEVVAEALANKSVELEILGVRFVGLRNKLQDMSVTYEILTMYRHFLDKLCPIWWKADNLSDTVFKIDGKHSRLYHEDSLISGGSLDLDKIVASLKKVDSNPYFKDPQQIIDLFENKRRQCLNYLHLGVHSTNILSSINKNKHIFKQQMNETIKEYHSCIKIYNYRIEFEEKQEVFFEKLFYKILYKDFHELYASYDACKLHTCVQYVNTRIFGDIEDPKDALSTLMGNLEREYMDLSLKMDNLDVNVVNKATKQAFAEDLKLMKEAFLAQRMLKECNILTKALYSSFEPPRTRKKHSTSKKSDSKHSSVKVIQMKP